MSENQNLSDEELKIRLPKRAKFIAIGWIIFCIVVLLAWLKASPENTVHSLSLGDIGAFLSGIFSILALYGFIEAYLIQSQELRLQRLELKESIKAQQGSEIALKEQSEALQAQLKISEEQFNLYLLEAKAKIPILKLLKINTFTVSFLHMESKISNEIDLLKDSMDLSLFKKDSHTLTEIIFYMEVSNIGGGGRLVDLKNPIEVDDIYYMKLTSFDIIGDSTTNICDNYLIKIEFKINSINPTIISNSETFNNFILTFVENMKIETNFRCYERSYKQKYKLCRNNFFDELLQHKNSTVKSFEKMELQYLLGFGYKMEIVE